MDLQHMFGYFFQFLFYLLVPNPKKAQQSISAIYIFYLCFCFYRNLWICFCAIPKPLDSSIRMLSAQFLLGVVGISLTYLLLAFCFVTFGNITTTTKTLKTCLKFQSCFLVFGFLCCVRPAHFMLIALRCLPKTLIDFNLFVIFQYQVQRAHIYKYLILFYFKLASKFHLN